MREEMRRIRKIGLIVCLLGIAGCLLALIPCVRGVMTGFLEIFIHRPLRTKEVWHSRLFSKSIVMLAVFLPGCLFFALYKKIVTFIEKSPVPAHGGGGVLLTLPVVFGFVTVLLFGVDMIFWDEWDGIVNFMKQLDENGLNFAGFFAQHNEHRIFFPRIIFYVFGQLTKLNIKTFLYISLAFNVVRYAVMVLFLKKTAKTGKGYIMPALLTGLCVFSTVQVENILWGFQTAWFMLACFAVLSFYMFYLADAKGRDLYYVPCVIFGLIASFSSLQGLFVFPAILCVLVLLSLTNRKIRVKTLLFIAVPLVFSFCFYFRGWHKPARHPDYFGASPVNILRYFFASIGSSICPFPFPNLAGLTGVILSAAAVFLCLHIVRTKKTKDNIFPLCIVVFGFAFSAAITTGRSGFLVEQALSSRYTTFSMFILTGLILIIINVFDTKKYNAVFYVFAAVTALVIVQNASFMESAILHSKTQKENAAILADYKNRTLESLQRLYPWQNLRDAYSAIQYVEQRGWSVFRNKKEQET